MSIRFIRVQRLGTDQQGHVQSPAVVGGASPPLPDLVPFIAGEDIMAGQLVSLDLVNNTVWLAEADGVPHRQHPIGYANNSTLTGGTVYVVVAGERIVADAFWDGGAPTAANVGDLAFMSETPGNTTRTAPAATGDVNAKVSVVSSGGAGASKALVQIGDGVLIT